MIRNTKSNKHEEFIYDDNDDESQSYLDNIVEVNDYHNDQANDDRTIYLSPLPSPKWVKDYPGTNEDIKNKWNTTIESLVKIHSEQLKRVEAGTIEKGPIPWSTMCCGGERVNGTSQCVVLPYHFVKRRNHINANNAASSLLCLCSKKENELNLSLYFDLGEQVITKKLHLSSTKDKGKGWTQVALDFQVHLKEFFTSVKGESIKATFFEHVQWYRDNYYADFDPKSY